MTPIRKRLLDLSNEYKAKHNATGDFIYRVSEIECFALLSMEDSITLDWLRRRYGDYMKQTKTLKEPKEATDAKLEVIKRLAETMKEEQ